MEPQRSTFAQKRRVSAGRGGRRSSRSGAGLLFGVGSQCRSARQFVEIIDLGGVNSRSRFTAIMAKASMTSETWRPDRQEERRT
jgi:hypothetical protein